MRNRSLRPRLEPPYLPSAGRAGTASRAGWNGGGKAGGQIRPRLDRFQSREIALHAPSRGLAGRGFVEAPPVLRVSHQVCCVFDIHDERHRSLSPAGAGRPPTPACGSRLARVIGACNALGGRAPGRASPACCRAAPRGARARQGARRAGAPCHVGVALPPALGV